MSPDASRQPLPRPVPLRVDHDARQGLEPYFRSPQLDGRFHNPWPNESTRSLRNVLKWKLGGASARPAGKQRVAQPVHLEALRDYGALRTPGKLLWLGHASFAFEIDGVPFLVDPVFGAVAGVVPRVTPLPCAPAEVPAPRVVLLTHGHPDHLDSRTLRQLVSPAAGELPLFVVPRALGAALPRGCRRVVELGWWESVTVDGVEIILVPAQHWHRRGLTDEDRCLWGGYVVRGSCALYHSGDTGYFGGFEAIGRVVPGIDVACLPLGAYEPRWFMGSQHMAPEESLAAFAALGAGHFVAMHWGTFDLSDEAVDGGPHLLRELVRGSPSDDRVHVLRHGGVFGFGAGGAPEVAGRW